MQRLRTSGFLSSMFWWAAAGLPFSACGSSGHGLGDLPTSTANAGSGGGAMLSSDAGAVIAPLPRPERVDLLLMVDNSYGMNEKQPLFADAVTGLLRRLRQPDCVDAQGNHGVPSAAGGVCPAGYSPEFEAVSDINVAVISSSLGDAGDSYMCTRSEQRDMAHLLGSTERGAVASMNSQGFLEWREGADDAAFQRDVEAMIVAAGQGGCGFEASLEAWYRFLIEPEPYESLTRVACSAGQTETNCIAPRTDAEGRVLLDQTLLAQRAAFLRPDSLLMIASLSDENDCSIRIGNQSWLVSRINGPMPRAASVCASNPNSECCYSCAMAPPSGCSADPICDQEGQFLEPEADHLNLRCVEQQRRFGFDFLYPTERYVRALTEPRLCPSAPSLATEDCPGEIIDNPLFAGGRPMEHVSFTSVVGVPWQDIVAVGGAGPPSFKPVAGLSGADWDRVLGRPAESPPVPPSEPFMVESTTPRPGIESGNPINGHEYDTSYASVPSRPTDLQYACIFPLAEPFDCSLVDEDTSSCECHAEYWDSPLCAQVPGESAPGEIQYFSRAFPGLRHLEVLRGYSERGGNAALGSVCARDTTDDSQPTYGYRPAMQALLERLTPILQAPTR
ncbi:MAG TPA: hypothetical protein VNN80_11270 [Polyangiaceae bacterium]|nr:hypothetical protein [Polyangiaceae bacterium]